MHKNENGGMQLRQWHWENGRNNTREVAQKNYYLWLCVHLREKIYYGCAHAQENDSEICACACAQGISLCIHDFLCTCARKNAMVAHMHRNLIQKLDESKCDQGCTLMLLMGFWKSNQPWLPCIKHSNTCNKLRIRMFFLQKEMCASAQQ